MTGKVAGYRAPAGELSGYRTYVKFPDADHAPDTRKEQALPSPPWSRSKPSRKPEYNTPGSSGESADGKNLHEDKVRTKSLPGEESPPDDSPARVGPKRRPKLSEGQEDPFQDILHLLGAHLAAMKGRPFPGPERQHVQRGDAKLYYKKYYRKNRNKLRRRTRKWYNRYKNRWGLRKDRIRRKDFPEKFERKPSGGYSRNTDRAKDWRNQRKASLDIPFELGFGVEGFLRSVDLDLGVVKTFLDGTLTDIPIEEFLQAAVFRSEEDMERVFQYLDDVFEYAEEAPSVSKVASRYADFLYEKKPPEMDRKYDRAHKFMWNEIADEVPPAAKEQDAPVVPDNPGSAKVIPYNHDFVNRMATRIAEIRAMCGPEVVRKSQGIPVKLRRVDAKNHIWLFDAKGSSGTYRVKVKVLPKKGVKDPKKLDVLVSCSCPYWQWQGPEYHAQTTGYLYGKPRGTASSPDIKDPEKKHGACKHVLAALAKVSGFSLAEKWGPKLAHLQEALVSGDLWVVHSEEAAIARVVGRYLANRGYRHANL